MKLSEMKPMSNKKESNFPSISQALYEDYYDLVEKKCNKIYSNKTYLEKEDIMHEVIYKSVEQHKKLVKTSKNISDLSEDFIMRKSIDRGVWDFVYEDGTIKDKPHFRVDGKNYLANVVVLDEPAKKEGKGMGEPLKDIIPDDDLDHPLDKLIYEEYIDVLLDSIDDFENSPKPKGFHKKRKVDIKRIAKMLLAEAPPKEIKVELGVSDSTIAKVRRNILLPLALMVIDDKMWYEKYWDVLSKQAKKIVFMKKGIAF